MASDTSQNLGPALVAVAWVFSFIAIVIVTARFYVRRNIIQRLSLDDWIILFTLALALGDSIFVSIAVSWGLGQHVQNLDALHQMNSVKWVYLCEVFSIMCPCFGRISYAYLLLNIVTPTKGRRRFLWTIIAVQFVVDVGTVIISMSQCQPIQRFWDHNIVGTCWDVHIQEYTGFFQGSVCSLVDLLLAVFPASLFWNLNMGRKQKVILSCMMGLGIL
ncbi:hypothetical protein M406DRAFT_252473 [Cryphonectria parasitica EP155]|uniref:Rhodopsin domain-containing protein n=1 Tax=Cryphonectria parasitica (strain ATCC 38755 / EP155) TaxID=660469 RepID=A0A9P5CRA1_CRYP1|nr:uncharacterized protein M406DRAFT_252473 [Cryphonectria parasitica EP155]KAF3767312.1 hypothetical protein M406DRAFT_252473 [Cryphonectria parasitica EP155]